MAGKTPEEPGAPAYYLANFSQKLHENEEILARGEGYAPPDPPLFSLNSV